MTPLAGANIPPFFFCDQTFIETFFVFFTGAPSAARCQIITGGKDINNHRFLSYLYQFSIQKILKNLKFGWASELLINK